MISHLLLGLNVWIAQLVPITPYETPCFSISSEGEFTDLTNLCRNGSEDNAMDLQEVLQQGLALVRERKDREAIPAFDQVLALNPNYAEVYVVRGNCWKALGNLQAAYRDYENAARLFEERNEDAIVETLQLMMRSLNQQGDY